LKCIGLLSPGMKLQSKSYKESIKRAHQADSTTQTQAMQGSELEICRLRPVQRRIDEVIFDRVDHVPC